MGRRHAVQKRKKNKNKNPWQKRKLAKRSMGREVQEGGCNLEQRGYYFG